jgi:hypothetical protein
LRPGVGAWTRTDAGSGRVRFEIGPPGARLWLPRFGVWCLLAVFVLPFSGLGIVAALEFRDFPWALRVLGGVLGGAGLLALGLPLLYGLVRAYAWRERVVIVPAGVAVLAGLPGWVRRIDFEGWGEFECALAPKEGRGLWARLTGCLPTRLTQSGVRVEVGLGSPGSKDLGEALCGALTAAKAQVAQAPIEARPEDPEADSVPPLHRGPLEALRAFGAGLARSVRQPLPYLLCDVSAIGLAFAAQTIVSHLDPVRLYPIAFAGYVVALVVRVWDPSSLTGLAQVGRSAGGSGLPRPLPS